MLYLILNLTIHPTDKRALNKQIVELFFFLYFINITHMVLYYLALNLHSQHRIM